MKVAPYFWIESKRSCQILSIVEGAVARWRQIGKGIGMTVSGLNAFGITFEYSERLSTRRIIKLIK